ncbi:MAG TPA: GyrI-like domain-containing protein, partial [Saprospiraceae bacterium]|nr:GyrI-like domain-containing protein [Saprospiraceae bacterium]
ELTYGSPWEGTGAQMSWKSDVTGNGSNTYTNTVENKLIESDLNFEGMDPSYYSFELNTTEKNSTNLTWTMKTRLGFPYNVMGPLFKYMIKKSYRKGLDNIEKVVIDRKAGSYNGYKVSEILLSDRNYAMNRKEVKASEVRDFYSQSLGPIFQKIQAEGLTMTGKPVALYFSYDRIKEKTDMAAAVPINIAREIKDLSFINISPQSAVQVEYTGDYNGLASVHEAIRSYMMDRMLTKNGPSIEEYISDPIEEKDPTKYITKVIYPITKK